MGQHYVLIPVSEIKPKPVPNDAILYSYPLCKKEKLLHILSPVQCFRSRIPQTLQSPDSSSPTIHPTDSYGLLQQSTNDVFKLMGSFNSRISYLTHVHQKSTVTFYLIEEQRPIHPRNISILFTTNGLIFSDIN